MKPVVHYRKEVTSIIPGVGSCAVVSPIDHPSPYVSNTKPVATSRIVSMGENGEFETMNTRYVPTL